MISFILGSESPRSESRIREWEGEREESAMSNVIRWLSSFSKPLEVQIRFEAKNNLIILIPGLWWLAN